MRNRIADIVANPLISPEVTNQEKTAAIQDLCTAHIDPSIHSVFQSHLWRGHPLEQPVGGYAQSLLDLTSEDLREYYEEKYRIPNLRVYAAGGVDLESTVEWAESALDGRAGGRRNARSPPPMPGPGYTFRKSDSDLVQVAMGFPAIPDGKDDSYAKGLLTAILGMGRGSRMFQAVGEQKALAYSISSSNGIAISDAGSLFISFSCLEGNAREAMSAVTAEFRKMLSEGLQNGELDCAKAQMKAVCTGMSGSLESRLIPLSIGGLTDGPLDSIEEQMKKSEAVTEDDVMRAAERIIRPDRLNVAVIGRAGSPLRSMDISDFGF